MKLNSSNEVVTSAYPAPVLAGPLPPAAKKPCLLALLSGSSASNSVEFACLLRHRLRIAVLIVLVPCVYFVFRQRLEVSVEFAGHDFMQALHVGVIFLTSGLAALLWSRRPLSVRQLRGIEAILFGAIVAFFAVQQYFVFCVDKICRAPDQAGELVRLAIASSSIRWFFLIVIYGVFIPNTWKRCALAVGAAALLPVVLTAAAALRHDRFSNDILLALGDMTILLGSAITIAVFGSYRIQVLQEQAREARQIGQYRLKQRLGAGGMGEVYLAEHLLLRRPCAVKLIRPEQAGDPRNLERFEREVQATATLTHWNSVEVFDYGRADDGTFYYVMEYLPGQNLDSLVTQYGPLPAARAVHLLRQTCRALREAHGIGLLHRDIKPSNVFACDRGGVYDVAKLLYFGLVQAAGLPAEADRLTTVGSIVGSPPFMSPEQAMGKSLDNRSDIYSLGAVAYFVLTGRPPFPRDTAMQMLMAHAYEAVPPPADFQPSIPDDVQDVVLRCLEKDPAKRYPDVASLEKALAACACADAWDEEQARSWWQRMPERRDSTDLATVNASPVPAG